VEHSPQLASGLTGLGHAQRCACPPTLAKELSRISLDRVGPRGLVPTPHRVHNRVHTGLRQRSPIPASYDGGSHVLLIRLAAAVLERMGRLRGGLEVATRTDDLQTKKEIEVFLRRLEKRGG